jgi:uncharacterized protein (TIGR00369 family)
MMKSRTATPEMVAEANPPSGYLPITSTSAFGWENGPIFERKDDTAHMRGFRVAERHINAGGMCHGGMTMTFADILLAMAVNAVWDGPFVTIRLTTDFIDAARLGDWVEGEATAYDVADGVVPVSCVIRSEGNLIASASGLFKVFAKRN